MKKLKEFSDEELAVAYINGDNQAFEILLARNQSKLFAYILFVVHDREIANDVFQDTFLKVISKLQEGKYKPTGKFSAWLMRIAHNVIMDNYREKKSNKLVEPNENNDLANLFSQEMLDNSIEDRVVNTQVLSDVKLLMELLPQPQREVVYMRYYQQLPFKEIAALTNVSINTALGRMRYAVINMRRMISDNNMSLQLID